MKNTFKRYFAVLLSCILLIGSVTGAFGADDGTEFNHIDTKEVVAVRETGAELAVTVVENGAVLLRNEKTSNGSRALPLEKGEKVNVFGWAATDDGFVLQGTGSGTGNKNNPVTFMSALKLAGIPYNKTLAKKYSNLALGKRTYTGEAGKEDEGFANYYGILEADPSFLDEELLSQAEDFSDTAIVVIGRLMGEGNDCSHYQYLADGTVVKDRKQLSLSENEEYLIKTVSERFEKVVVVLNSANPMECGFVEDYDIDALVWVGYPGTKGAKGLANLLVGKANFSGKLSDTYAYDLATAASYANSGREGIGTWSDALGYGSDGNWFNYFSDYLEDIYIGYKWYETADTEGFWNDTDNNYGKGYDGVVQYPFGYGLSYTDFSWKIIDTNYKDGDTLDKMGTVEITVAVENVGDVAGADVVELYYTPPYTKGGIEKSSVNLGAFAKTTVLAPGQGERITLSLPVESMKSYDCYDKNNNGFMGYELEGGEYILSLRTDSHTLKSTVDGKNTLTLKVSDGGYKYEVDSVTGNVVENQFTNYKNEKTGAESKINEPISNNAHSIDGGDEPKKLTYLTRADFKGTFPTSADVREGGWALIRDTVYLYNFSRDDYSLTEPKWNSEETNLSVADLYGVPYSDERWNHLTSQLSFADAANLVAKGGFGTIKLAAIKLENTGAADGPSCIGGKTNYPCSTLLACTWDWNMAYQVGLSIAADATAQGVMGWYGPGANLHRSPLGGRNFEYYSEDAKLSGVICAYHVLGAKTNGVTAYIKHIAVNDVERFRGGTYKWLTEQNLRENYLLPFEYAVKIGGANGMMASVDRVGSVQASSSYAMLTAVLRDEWGFVGTVITDYYQSKNINDVDECVRAGCNLMLCPWGGEGLYSDLGSAPAQQAIFNSAKEIIYTYADTMNFRATAEKIDKISLVYTPVKEEETTEIPTEELTEEPTETPTEEPIEETHETTGVESTEEATKDIEEPTENGGEQKTDPPAQGGGCGASIGAGAAGAVAAATLSLIAFKKRKKTE